MKTICSRCGGEINRSDYPENCLDDVIIRGICDKCADYVLWPHRPALMDFLDNLNAPVLVINSLGIVNSANKYARELLKKELPDIEGFQGGNVFECAFAKLPEGCGNTLHCDGCTIRNTVMDTFKSGKSYLKTPAGLCRGTPDKYQEIQFIISTEKVKDVVLLRIDKVDSNE